MHHRGRGFGDDLETNSFLARPTYILERTGRMKRFVRFVARATLQSDNVVTTRDELSVISFAADPLQRSFSDNKQQLET